MCECVCVCVCVCVTVFNGPTLLKYHAVLTYMSCLCVVVCRVLLCCSATHVTHLPHTCNMRSGCGVTLCLDWSTFLTSTARREKKRSGGCCPMAGGSVEGVAVRPLLL